MTEGLHTFIRIFFPSVMIRYESRFYIDNEVSHISNCAQRLKLVHDSLITT